jgi:hypothetical protein
MPRPEEFITHSNRRINHDILKVAILGSRGIPACYSGYDTLVEELSYGLVDSGRFDVLVYCRS